MCTATGRQKLIDNRVRSNVISYLDPLYMIPSVLKCFTMTKIKRNKAPDTAKHKPTI